MGWLPIASRSSSPRTLDKEYNEITAELYFNQTHVADMLKLDAAISKSISKPSS